ncbi:hypothetical protein OIU34_20025 [Pararhizobium sp. BT-229]|uniref:hypothetical protein n=1 Tax=Pararhizobium sp. BT-229 TaxID=2986923 RepID=UPI0021F7244A|nr:hypothetical protein [Pararhizobium sp. BT-229]MCV9964175.1 hypothetical protein [Pararhizobium sp. BT-229]
MLISAFTNWGRLARALEFYQRRGFLLVELDWSAPKEICAITCPDEGRMYAFDGEYLVGSAEQAFIDAQNGGTLPPGRYVALTPCFRREPVVSETHLRHFMKVELFASHDARDELAYEFALLAAEFMRTETAQVVELVGTSEGYDLEIAGIEVGSYAARTANGMSWTCGTGLAEPRFSTAVENADAGLIPIRKAG